MPDRERIERIRTLVESFHTDQAERERLKQEADASLARLQQAVREFVGEARKRETAPAAHG
jgi:hypothetical protein